MAIKPNKEEEMENKECSLGAIDTLNLIDEIHPTKNNREDYHEAVRVIKDLAIKAIEEGRL